MYLYSYVQLHFKHWSLGRDWSIRQLRLETHWSNIKSWRSFRAKMWSSALKRYKGRSGAPQWEAYCPYWIYPGVVALPTQRRWKIIQEDSKNHTSTSQNRQASLPPPSLRPRADLGWVSPCRAARLKRITQWYELIFWRQPAWPSRDLVNSVCWETPYCSKDLGVTVSVCLSICQTRSHIIKSQVGTTLAIYQPAPPKFFLVTGMLSVCLPICLFVCLSIYKEHIYMGTRERFINILPCFLFISHNCGMYWRKQPATVIQGIVVFILGKQIGI